MAKIERFEDIEAWQKSRELASVVYGVSNQGPFSRDFGLRDQIRRAVVSVMSNIAEGFERGGNVEFRRFLSIAKGSAGEGKAQIYVAFDTGLIDKAQFDSLYRMTTETGNLIGGFMRYLTNHVGDRATRNP
ncbi:S23 ribosomal protein [Syntrophobacter sp. SbD1]|nr:S23 ribosomal protein [Syntrophobacter sp. SbD1]